MCFVFLNANVLCSIETFGGSVMTMIFDSWIYNYLCNQCLSPLMLWVRVLIRARCTTLYDKVCQWLVTGRLFSPCPPVSSTNITEIWEQNKSPPDKKPPQYWNNHTILLHVFYIEGDIKRYLKRKTPVSWTIVIIQYIVTFYS